MYGNLFIHRGFLSSSSLIHFVGENFISITSCLYITWQSESKVVILRDLKILSSLRLWAQYSSLLAHCKPESHYGNLHSDTF